MYMTNFNEELQLLWRSLDRLASHLPEDETEPEFGKTASKRYGLELDDPDCDLEEQREHQEVADYISDRMAFNLSRRLRHYTEQRNLFKVQQILTDFAALPSREISEEFYSAKELIDEAIDEIEGFEPVLLFSASGDKEEATRDESAILLPKLIVRVKAELVSNLAREPELLRRLSPREFEELIADIFYGFGYVVELTAPTRDGGKDVVAIRNLHGVTTKLLIECKRYNPPKTVDVGWVRQLYGVRHSERATKALIATTSYFTSDARKFERQHIYELELKDYDAVADWVQEYNQILKGGRVRGDT
jgi:HJR/Mrr/RecB family endonuclease